MDYNDRELLDLISEHNEEAMKIMYEKYEPYIMSQAKHFYNTSPNVGLDENDFAQDGMIALNDAIENYNMNLNTTFFTYATTCIQREMISSLISAKRLKHRFLNESLSLDQKNGNGVEFSLDSKLVTENTNPELLVMNADSEYQLLKQMKSILTDFEYQVFELKYNNFSYQEISLLLEKDIKSIDNALQRIRVKIAKILKKEKKDEKN